MEEGPRARRWRGGVRPLLGPSLRDAAAAATTGRREEEAVRGGGAGRGLGRSGRKRSWSRSVRADPGRAGAMEPSAMEPRLGLHELLHVFSFLEARDLLRAAQVDKLWNEVSRTKELWRQLCLRRWPSCRTSQLTLGPQTWRRYYLCRSELEFRMECGRPEDFTCKAIAGHRGEISQLACLSTGVHRYDGQEKSVACIVSSDHTVCAWDLQEAVEIWSSPPQPEALVNLVAFPQRQLVVTVDMQGLIKVWNAEDGRECAAFSLPTASSALEACPHAEGPFLLAACAVGALYVLALPDLQLLYSTILFPSSPVHLLCSPDCQWVYASSGWSSEVIHMGSCSWLLRQEEAPPASELLPTGLTSHACWATLEPARLVVLHSGGDDERPVVSTFELRTKKCRDAVDILAQEIASFPLPETAGNPGTLKAHGSQVVLLGAGRELLLFTIHGLKLRDFRDHQEPISGLWVDESRVITSSSDRSLRVYVWKKDREWPVLKSCYQLLGGSHRWSRGFTHVACDNLNVVGVERRTNGKSVLRSYCFKVSRD